MLVLKFARLHRGLSQTTFGRMASLRQTEVSLIEIGRLLPTPQQLHRMARALGMKPTDAADLMTELPDPLVPSMEPDDDKTVTRQ